MNEITYLIPKAAQEVLEEIKKQHEYDAWLDGLVKAWENINKATRKTNRTNTLISYVDI